MTAFNVVRFKVKPGHEEKFVEAHRRMRPALKGFLGASLIRTGDRSFCLVGEWRTFNNIETSRPQMIALLDEVRDLLEDLGGGLGVTDPVSGKAVAKLAPPKAKKTAPARRAPARKKAKKAKKAARRR